MLYHATLTMQKALLRYLNLPKVQREFCQCATNQQKDNGREFFKFPTFSQRISFLSDVSATQQFIGNVSVGMERSLI